MHLESFIQEGDDLFKFNVDENQTKENISTLWVHGWLWIKSINGKVVNLHSRDLYYRVLLPPGKHELLIYLYKESGRRRTWSRERNFPVDLKRGSSYKLYDPTQDDKFTPELEKGAPPNTVLYRKGGKWFEEPVDKKD